MTIIIIIAIAVCVIYAVSNKKQPVIPPNEYNPKTKTANFIAKQKEDRELVDKVIRDIKKENQTKIEELLSKSMQTDSSIIDVTDQPSKIHSGDILNKYASGVPFWTHQYVYSHTEINRASDEQKLFYRIFRSNFLSEHYFDLEGNTNYAFILLFDLLDKYEHHKDISKLEDQLKKLGQHYPKTKSYGISFLLKKMRGNGYNEDIERINNQYVYSNHNYDPDYWKLGSKFQSKLNLSNEEVNLLNRHYYPNNNFCSIEFCCLEVLKLYILCISELEANYRSNGTTLDDEFLFISDLIARKQFRYRQGSQNYKYSLETINHEIYTNIFKYCENAVRESYHHKRKLSTADVNYSHDEVRREYESRIITPITQLLESLKTTIAEPDEATEIQLYSLTTGRWRVKFEDYVNNYSNNLDEFVNSIIKLGELNINNPSRENIYYESSKFIAKYDKIESLKLYVYYLYYDLQSATIDKKQLTKTIQKTLFKTNEQLHDFEEIVSNLIKDMDLGTALKSVPKIYEVKRKRISLDKTAIREVQTQHSGTVELLNEYLQDEFEDDNISIQSQEINEQEIKIEIVSKIAEPQQSAFLNSLALNSIQIGILSLFSKSNFSILQSEIEEFAKSQGVFKNQVIESINEVCYDVLDDVLIEEDDDYYTIIPEYFDKILAK